MDGKPTIVTGVIGADIHVVGNKILSHALKESGFTVINLGIFVSTEEFINAAIETSAVAILVSSLYGHAELDCWDFKGKCREAGINNVLLYVGGNLVVGAQDWDEVYVKFKNMGFDRVAPPSTMPEDVIRWLHEDILITNCNWQ